MAKRAISVTLEDDNLVWLKGQTHLKKARSVSETLDRIVTEARLGGDVSASAIRSVVGTIDLAPDDPDMVGADAVVRDLIETSIGRPGGKRRG